VLNTLDIYAAQLAARVSKSKVPMAHVVQALWGAVGVNKLRPWCVQHTIGQGGQGCILEMEAAMEPNLLSK
jgi:hypothetical protein